jgi:quinol-cytochrome oxidoreductase complex cytochrome b subunit
VIIIHLTLLHEAGSTAPLKVVYGTDKIGFWTYFKEKDSFPLFISLSVFSYLTLVTPNLLGHPDNFIEANPSVTPLHIVPEWYFTPFYAILRACPDKVGGVVGMGSAIALLGLLPLYRFLDSTVQRDIEFSLAHTVTCTIFFVNFLLLGFLGSSPANEAFVIASKYACFVYFIYLII